jgi:hypothetical protein
MNETSCYDMTPVTMEFTYEEHDLLNSIICHAFDAVDIVIPCIYDLPEDSDVRQRYEMLNKIKNRSYALWSKRYGDWE